MVPKTKPPGGRRPTGPGGAKVSEYHQLTVRIPPEAVRQLDAAVAILRRPRWQLVTNAIAAYLVGGPALSEEEVRAVRTVLRLQPKGGD